MPDAVVDAAAALGRALAALGDAVAGAAPQWLAVGIVLHLANQVLRGRGWYAIVRSACGDPRLRPRDAIAAWVAGAAMGGLFSARGGDAVRVMLLTRRARGAGCPLLVGTLVAEAVGELLVGAGLVALALGVGVGPRMSAPSPTVVVAVALILAATVLAVRRFGPARRAATRVGHGCAALRTPGFYARAVLPWQLASRACRLGALACFLLAFGLPATPVAVLLVVFAQTSGRLLPFGPASVGAGAAMLAASFSPVTGTAVSVGQVATFFVGMSAILTAVGFGVAVLLCVALARSGSPSDTFGAAAQATAPAGRRSAVPLRRRLVARATSVPAP